MPGAYLRANRLTLALPGVAYGRTHEELRYARSTMHQLRPLLLRAKRWANSVRFPLAALCGTANGGTLGIEPFSKEACPPKTFSKGLFVTVLCAPNNALYPLMHTSWIWWYPRILQGFSPQEIPPPPPPQCHWLQ